ncbi:DUF1818 family protein [Synechococcus sp. AH-601-N10]|nr:DUF1818 family protein [Synechococcus sp. AH-601-N10]
MIQQEGPGWRLAHDLGRNGFPFLIGGEFWAVELTETELKGLHALLVELDHQHTLIRDQLMEEESITLELEQQEWWGCLDGTRDRWALQVVLHGNGTPRRGLEGTWPAPAAQAFLAALRTVWD